MAIKDTLFEIRERNGLTQAEMAERLFVTRQAVSRWECGDTQPGIDALKLIAAEFHVPIEKLLDMPLQAVCQSCGMPFYQEADHGSEAGGGRSRDFCSMCYENGAFVRDETMEELIEEAAPHMAAACRISRDEAVSFMGALLPHLKRWEQGQGR